MARFTDRDYYTSISGRLTILLRRVPKFRPLSEEIVSEIDSMSVKDRHDIITTSDAIIDLLQAQINELQVLKDKAGKVPGLKVIR